MCVRSGGGGYGGDNTHNHEYGIAHHSYYSEIHGRGGNSTDFLSFYGPNGWYQAGTVAGNETLATHGVPTDSATTANIVDNIVQTRGTTNLPAHFKVYVWCRTA